MLTPSEYDHLCDQLITLYDELDRAVIDDMVRRMMRMGKVSDATSWQAKQLQEAGLLYEDIISEIAKHSDASDAQVRTLFEDAGVQSVRNDNHYYTDAGLEGIIRLSDAALQTLNAGYVKCRGELRNLTLTTANTAQTAYLNACDLAYMEVSSGTMDYGTAIRRAVQSAADEGSKVLYPSGHSDRLDVAVRRSVLTGVGQTVRQLSAINAGDMGCDIMEITAHSGARPSHAEWQGKLVSLSGANAGRIIDGVKVLTTNDIGYGTGDGFGGWNCRHDWFPFIEGISSRVYSDERLAELNARNIEYNGKMYTEYEIDQMQRALERDIRARKRAVSAADTAVKNAPDESTAKQMQELFTAESVKLKKAEKELSTFLDQTGNLPDSTRIWVNGFGRSTAQRAVWANRKAVNNSSIDKSGGNGIIKSNKADSNIVIKPERKYSSSKRGSSLISAARRQELQLFEESVCKDNIETALIIPANGKPFQKTSGNERKVLFTVEEMKLMSGGLLSHNHSNGTTFSADDIQMLVQTDLQEIRACNSEGAFVLRNTDKPLPDFFYDSDLLEVKLTEIEEELLPEMQLQLINGEITFEEFDKGIQQAAVEKLMNEYGFDYYFEVR